MQFHDQNSLFQPFQQETFGFEGKKILGDLLGECLQPGSLEYAEKLVSLLRNAAFGRRKGTLVHHLKQLSQTSGTEQSFHVLRYAAYVSSNNLLDASCTDTLLRWILDGGNFWVVEALLALSTPTTRTFASALLNSAVRLGESDVARQLLQKDVDPNFSTSNNGNFSISTLDEAVRGRDTALARLLVQKGAEARSKTWEDLLLRKFDSCSDEEFDSCSDEEYLENVQFVIDYGQYAKEGFECFPRRTVLHNVIEVGDWKAVELVLQAGAHVNHIPRYLATPLQTAAWYGNAEVVKLLISAGADIDAPMGAPYRDMLQEDLQYRKICCLLTPLQIAMAKGQTAVAEILLQHGADVNGFDASAYYDAWIAEVGESGGFFDNALGWYKILYQTEKSRFWQHTPWEAYCSCQEFGLLDSPLQAAARKGNLAIARRLLSLGAKVHARGGYGTALQVAVSRKGNLELVKLLLDQGADVNAPAYDPVGRTALQTAIQYSDMETIHLLLESDADVNADVCLADGSTALQAAVHRNDVVLAKLLILLGADINAKPSSINGRTCLQAASEIGNMQMIDLLLKHGADVKGPPPKSTGGKTVLQAASEIGNMQIIHLPLIKHGADVKAPAPQSGGGKTVLQAAVAGKHIEVVRKLLEHGSDPNIINAEPSYDDHKDRISWPLRDSICTRQHGMTKLLLENGANPNLVSDCESALEVAINIKELQTVQLLVSHGASIIDLDCSDSESLLQVAAKSGSLPIFRFLIESGADLKGAMGTAALYTAVEYRRMEIIQFILSEGVNPNWEKGPRPKIGARLGSPISVVFKEFGPRVESPADEIIIKEEIADTLLCHGAEFDYSDKYHEDVCHQSLPMLRRLIKAGLKINRAPPASWRKSPLQYASREGMIDVVALLLEAGADVNMLPLKGNRRTALQGAAKGQHIRVAELLLSNGADVNAPPSKSHGATALQEAVIAGSLPLVVLLLKKGANVNAAPSAERGQTALEAAAKHGRLDIAHLLLKEDKERDTLQTRCMKAAELALLSGFPIVANALQEWNGHKAAASSAMQSPWIAW